MKFATFPAGGENMVAVNPAHVESIWQDAVDRNNTTLYLTDGSGLTVYESFDVVRDTLNFCLNNSENV